MFYQDVKPTRKAGRAACAARPVFSDSGAIEAHIPRVVPMPSFSACQAAHPVRLRMEMVEVVMAAVPGGSGSAGRLSVAVGLSHVQNHRVKLGMPRWG